MRFLFFFRRCASIFRREIFALPLVRLFKNCMHKSQQLVATFSLRDRARRGMLLLQLLPKFSLLVCVLESVHARAALQSLCRYAHAQSRLQHFATSVYSLTVSAVHLFFDVLI